MGAEWRNAGRISPLMDSLLHSYHKRVLAMSSVFFASYLRNVVDQTPIIYIIAQLRRSPLPPRPGYLGGVGGGSAYSTSFANRNHSSMLNVSARRLASIPAATSHVLTFSSLQCSPCASALCNCLRFCENPACTTRKKWSRSFSVSALCIAFSWLYTSTRKMAESTLGAG